MLFGDDLPPCTNLALRLRIPADVASTATLSPAHGATGLWRAALRAEWDGRRGLDIERNRVETANGAMVDIGNGPAKDDFLRLKLTAHGIFQPTPCQGGAVTNIVGAGWTSTHNPTNASDHQPYVVE